MSKGFYSLLITFLDDEYRRILPEFVYCASDDRPHSEDAPSGRLLVAEVTVRTPSVSSSSIVCLPSTQVEFAFSARSIVGQALLVVLDSAHLPTGIENSFAD